MPIPIRDGGKPQKPSKRRKRKPTTAASNGEVAVEAAELPAPTIHVPDEALGREDGGNGAEPAQARKKTRRGSRGGRGRKRKTPTTTEGQLD